MTAEELVTGLSESLRERSRILGAHSFKSNGQFVLYWMRTAVRVDENPALSLIAELSTSPRVTVDSAETLTRGLRTVLSGRGGEELSFWKTES